MATGLSTLEGWLQPAAHQLVNIAAAAGLSPHVSSARRSHAQQALLYRRFLAGQSRFPAAPPGNSMHELGLAFDLWVNDEEQLADLGTVWEQMGGVWGGHFKDPIHFEAGGDLSDYQVAVATDTPTDNQRPTDSRTKQIVDVAGSFVPGVGTISTVANLVKSVAPSTAENPFIDVLSSPYKMITTQPQFQFLSSIARMLF